MAAQTRRTYASKVRQFLIWLAGAECDGDPLADAPARDWAVRDGVPKVVLADRMGCLKGGVVANKVVPTAEYVRFATHHMLTELQGRCRSSGGPAVPAAGAWRLGLVGDRVCDQLGPVWVGGGDGKRNSPRHLEGAGASP